jgi:hypothetical protein
MLLRLLSEPIDADAGAGAKRRKGRRPDRPERGEWFDDWDEGPVPTLRPKAGVVVSALRMLVLDEADALLMPLSKYATAQQKISRAAHPKEAATLLQLLSPTTASHAELQIVAASATVGRPLRRREP